jgi:biopolymer transport protein ExbB/TolQ
VNPPHVPDVSRPQATPPMTPWWQWLVLAMLTAGAILAAAVLSRQGGHIAANRKTASEVEAISSEVRAVKSQVHYLREFVRNVEAEAAVKSEANRRRIERVERDAEDDRP